MFKEVLALFVAIYAVSASLIERGEYTSPEPPIARHGIGEKYAASDRKGTPTFKLLSSRSDLSDPKSDIPELEVTFPNGEKDMLVLHHYNALPNSMNINHKKICNYLGYLENEKDARVAVTGCMVKGNPGSKMHISLLSKRSLYQKSFALDFDGNVHAIPSSRSKNGHTLTENEQLNDENEIQSFPFDREMLSPRANTVPSIIKATIRLGTDRSALEAIQNKWGTTVDNWLAEIFTHAQMHFYHPSLGHKINFEVIGPTFFYDEVLNGSGDTLDKVRSMMRESGDENVAMYAIIVDDYTASNGIAWLGYACTSYNVAAVLGPSRCYPDDESGYKCSSILETSETMAHELGHVLGMYHDGIYKSGDYSNRHCRQEDIYDISQDIQDIYHDVGIPCNQCVNWNGYKLTAQTDKTGECCTGYLDGHDHPEYWSDCSVKMFEASYVQKNWETCMPKDHERLPGEKDVCFDVTGNGFGYAFSWSVGSCETPDSGKCCVNPVIKSNYGMDAYHTQRCCLPPGEYKVKCQDGFGNGWRGASLQINGKTYCEDFTEGREKIEDIIVSTPATDATPAPATTDKGLCYASGISIDEVTQLLCYNTPNVCEAFMYVGQANGVKIATCTDYCQAYRLHCDETYGNHGDCHRGSKRSSCDSVSLNSYICVCKTATDEDPCASSPCKNGGVCKRKSMTNMEFSCECADGFLGDLCEIDHCTPPPCANGGVCQRKTNLEKYPMGFQCQCTDGFGGDQCQECIDEWSACTGWKKYCGTANNPQITAGCKITCQTC